MSNRVESSASALPSFVWVTIGWLAFFILWALFILAWGDATPLGVLISGFTATTTGALLGIFVWKWTGLLDLPEHISSGFVGLHLAALVLFSWIWMALGNVIAFTLSGEPLSVIQWDIQTNSWRLFMGVWLYVLISGISYAIRLRARMQDERRKASRAEALAAEARMQALRSQLHPHFLFNALHSVSALVRESPAKAEDAMEQLGDLLRYAMRDGKDDIVSLSEEWRFVCDYLELQSLRLGERMKLDISLDPSAASVPVPALILQPLVENAVIHGIADHPTSGMLSVRATLRDHRLVIEVVDDGPGMANEGERSGSEPKGTGQGLSVLRRRLEYVYGDRASLSFESGPDGGTHAVLQLPDDTRDRP